MEWCGWSVHTYDWAISPEHDLSNEDLQSSLLSQVSAVDFWMVAMDCSTFSRARERYIPGHPNQPRPLRDSNCPLGLPGLSARDKARVLKANGLVQFLTRLLAAAHGAGAAGALENPLNAWIWAIPGVAALLQLTGWQDFNYHSCSLGGARAKAQKIRANIDELESVRCQCHHVHCPTEWKPKWDEAANAWCYPSSEEQEYTAELAFNIAVAASAWACRVGRATMKLPRPPRPAETGSRVEWLAFPPSATREDAMPGLAARLGFTPPARLASTIPALSRTQGLKELPSRAVYIGHGNLALKLAKSKWSSPFRPGPHGTPEACVRKYAHWLESQPSLLALVPALKGVQLLCDCSPGEPCHGEALVAAVYKTYQGAPAETDPVVPRPGYSAGTTGNRTRTSPATLAVSTGAGPPTATAAAAPCTERRNAGPHASNSRGSSQRRTATATAAADTDALAVLEPRRPPAAATAALAKAILEPRPKGKVSLKPRATAMLVAASAVTQARGQALHDVHLPRPMQLRWSQASLDVTLRGLFPQAWTANFQMPNLEDLLNASPFHDFHLWLETHNIDSEDSGAWAQATKPGWRAAALGQQRGAIHSAGQVEALLGFGLTPEEHYAQSCNMADAGASPWAETAASEYDLRFAAAQLVQHRGRLRDFRQATRKAFAELADRCKPFTKRLCKHQPPSVQRIAGHVHIGLVAVLVIVMAWPDWRLPRRFVEGFQVIGELEPTRIYEHQAHEPPVHKADLLANSEQLIASIEAQRPLEEIDFIWESSLKEEVKGFAGPPQSRDAFDKLYGKGGWTPVPAFCIEQACGKKRRIDNGRRGGQNDATAFTEKARLCSAFQPALHTRLIWEEAQAAGADLAGEHIELETGGEDLPDAFRSIPCRPEDLDVNIVAARDPQSRRMMYQQVEAMLFGFSSAVMGFGRWSRFLEALGRRILALLWSMYVDDGSLTDASKARGSGQELVGYAFCRLGTPFADAKRATMSDRGTFLGVDHYMHQAASHGAVSFRPTGKLQQKATAQLADMLAEDSCTPAAASKFRGTAGFCAHALWGRVGRAGFGPFRQRQYSDTEPWSLSHSLRRSISFFQCLLTACPSRIIDCKASRRPLVVIASDAQADAGTQPGCGYLLYDARSGRKSAACCSIPEKVLSAWGYDKQARQSGNPIAICEAAVVAAAAVREAEALAEADVVWFIDNTTALHSYVKGTSANAHVERAAHLLHFLAHKFNFRVWFEFVDSNANWADGISRHLRADPFARSNGFAIDDLDIKADWWAASLLHLWQAMGLKENSVGE